MGCSGQLGVFCCGEGVGAAVQRMGERCVYGIDTLLCFNDSFLDEWRLRG